MGITVTKQRYKIRPLLCVTDKNPYNITRNVLVFLHGFHVTSAGETTRVPANVGERYVYYCIYMLRADEANDTEFACYNQAKSSYNDASRELEV